jgi:hypothetical protein
LRIETSVSANLQFGFRMEGSADGYILSGLKSRSLTLILR